MSNTSLDLTNATKGPLIWTKELACAAPIQPNFLGLTVLLIAILIVTFIGNLLVLLAVIFFRQLRSITNYFLVSLAVSDILIALLSLPFRIDQTTHNGHWCLSLEACQTWIIVDTLCSFASIWNLAIISIDRYVAIKHPIYYQSLERIKIGCGMISFVWIYSIFLSLMKFINWTDSDAPHFTTTNDCGNIDRVYYTVAVSLSFFLPLLIIIVMYGMVFEVALKQTRAMAAGTETIQSRGGSLINLIREVKAARMLATVVGCFVVCWLPFNIVLMILLWNLELITKLSDQQRIAIAMIFIYILPALNSTMNPFIYALFNRDFRFAFLKLVKRITGRRLGTVGYGENMESTNAPAITMVDLHIEGLSNNPTISQPDLHSYTNEAHTAKPVDTHAMDTTLDSKTKMDYNIEAAQNGEESYDITLDNNEVAQGKNDVMDGETGGSPKVDQATSIP